MLRKTRQGLIEDLTNVLNNIKDEDFERICYKCNNNILMVESAGECEICGGHFHLKCDVGWRNEEWGVDHGCTKCFDEEEARLTEEARRDVVVDPADIATDIELDARNDDIKELDV